MKQKIITSKYFRVRVHATQEEEVFDTQKIAEEWCDKVMFTHSDSAMKFDIIEITERTTIYNY